MSSAEPSTLEELVRSLREDVRAHREDLRANRKALESLGDLLVTAMTLLAPCNPEIAEALAHAAGIDLPGSEPPECAAEVPEHVRAAIRRAYQTCTAPLRLSSAVVERLGRAAEHWNRIRPQELAHVGWEDMAHLAIAKWLKESGSGEHEAGAKG